MKVAVCHLESLAPYSQSRRVGERLPKEPWDKYEERVWRDRMHVNPEGQVIIPGHTFKRALDTAASMLRMRIPGKDRSEYGKVFKSGVLVPNPLVLPIKASEAKYEALYLSGSGKKGGMDVLKYMPLFPSWSGVVEYFLLNEEITEEVFEKHVTESGNFVGIGRWRCEMAGSYGRFKVNRIEWK